MVEQLLNASADKSIRDDHWTATPLDWAKENKADHAIKRFAEMGISEKHCRFYPLIVFCVS